MSKDPLTPDGLNTIRAVNPRQRSYIVFKFESSDAPTIPQALIFWINYETNWVKFGHMSPGESMTMDSYVGHPWVAFNSVTKEILNLNGSFVFWPPDKGATQENRHLVRVHKPAKEKTQEVENLQKVYVEKLGDYYVNPGKCLLGVEEEARKRLCEKGRISADQLAELVSGGPPTASYLRFRYEAVGPTGNTPQALLCWINFKGQWVKFAHLKPGEFHDMNSYVGHLWIAYNTVSNEILTINGTPVYWPSDSAYTPDKRLTIIIQKPDDTKRIELERLLPVYSEKLAGLLDRKQPKQVAKAGPKAATQGQAASPISVSGSQTEVKPAIRQGASGSTSGKSPEHVMLSYNHGSSSVVKRLHEYLRSNGVRTWIDSEDMRGRPLLEAMCDAIERAVIIIICFSEAYQNSENCQDEATYANKKKKPVIFVRVQEGYKLDGWLLMMSRDALYYDITGSKFDSEAGRILTEVREVMATAGVPSGGGPAQVTRKDHSENLSATPAPAKAPAPTSPAKESSKDPPWKKWNAKQVTEWLNNNGLDDLESQFTSKKVDGRKLFVLSNYAKKDEENFKKELEKDFTLSMLQRETLVDALKDLSLN